METDRIRDGKKSDRGSGINTPDPQHCFFESCVLEISHLAAVLRWRVMKFTHAKKVTGQNSKFWSNYSLNVEIFHNCLKLPFFGLKIGLLFTDLFRILFRIQFWIRIQIRTRIRIQTVYFGSGSDPDPVKSYGSGSGSATLHVYASFLQIKVCFLNPSVQFSQWISQI